MYNATELVKSGLHFTPCADHGQHFLPAQVLVCMVSMTSVIKSDTIMIHNQLNIKAYMYILGHLYIYN